MRAFFGRSLTNTSSSAHRLRSDRPGAERLVSRRMLRRAGFALALFLLFVSSSPRIAQADAVDFAVDAVVTVGSIAGVPIPREAAGVVKELVRCAVDQKSASDCARASVVKTVLKNVPAEGQQLVGCVLSGRNVAACGGEAALAKVPEAARPLARCIVDGGNVGSCAERFAINQATGAIDNATKQATDEVLRTLKDIKADAEDAVADMPPAVRNIMALVEGIEEGKWDKILEGGGPIIAKAVITTIINVIVTPAFAPIVGPVVDVMVQERVDLAINILKASKNPDPVEIGELIFQFYLQTMVSGACALIPDGAFKDATCGNLAKAIAGVVGAVGDVVDAILTGVGAVGEAIVELFDDIFGDGLEDPEVCGPTKDFFASNYMPCMGAAAGDAPAAFSVTSAANGACRNQFNKCYGDRTAGMCSALGSAFNDQVRQLNVALADGANMVTSAALGAYLSQRKAQLCRFGYAGRIDNAVDDFLGSECSNTLSKTLPLPVNACNFKPPHMKGSRGHLSACLKGAGTGAARDQMNQTCAAHCRDNPKDCEPPPVCTDPMTGRTFSYTGPFADQMTCPTQPPAVSQVKFNWDDLFNNKDKPIPNFVVNDPGRLGGARGGTGNFVIDGGGGSVKMNDALSDIFVSGKCKLRATTPNLIMYLDPTPSTGLGRLALKTMQFVSSSGFDDCGPTIAKLPPGTGSGGAYLSKGNDEKPKKIKRLGKSVPPTGSGGAYPSYYQPDKPPLTGRSPEDIAGGATAGGTALGGVSGNQGYIAPGGGYRAPTVPCMTCGPKGSAKPTNTGSGGPSLAYPNPSSKPGPVASPKPGPVAAPKPGPIAAPRPPSAPRGPDPNIDYGGMAPRPGPSPVR